MDEVVVKLISWVEWRIAKDNEIQNIDFDEFKSYISEEEIIEKEDDIEMDDN
jgi:hypothetical protein